MICNPALKYVLTYLALRICNPPGRLAGLRSYIFVKEM